MKNIKRLSRSLAEYRALPTVPSILVGGVGSVGYVVFLDVAIAVLELDIAVVAGGLDLVGDTKMDERRGVT